MILSVNALSETSSGFSLLWLVEGLGGEASDTLSKDCRSSRRGVWSSSQLVPCRPLKSKAIDDASLKSTYKLSHSWVIVWIAVETNGTKCVLKRILIQDSGLEVLQTCLIHCPPHMLGSRNKREPPNLSSRAFRKRRFTILKEDPATYPHICFGPMTYMGTAITKQAMQCLPYGNTRSTIETIKKVINLNKLSCSQVFAAVLSWNL
jgi:hypothetical protein